MLRGLAGCLGGDVAPVLELFAPFAELVDVIDLIAGCESGKSLLAGVLPGVGAEHVERSAGRSERDIGADDRVVEALLLGRHLHLQFDDHGVGLVQDCLGFCDGSLGVVES